MFFRLACFNDEGPTTCSTSSKLVIEIYLEQAVLDYNQDLIDDYLKYGVNTNTTRKSERLSMLYIAIIDGNMDIVRFLVSQGINFHIKPSDETILTTNKLTERSTNHAKIASFFKVQLVCDESYNYTTSRK